MDSFDLLLTTAPNKPLWVFGYGSLIWNPGFSYVEARTATLQGYHRSLCVWCWSHRGTQENPGLVFGLERGGHCVGRVFRVAPSDRETVLQYLYQREMLTSVYVPRLLPVRGGNFTVQALTFAIDPDHIQYAGGLNIEKTARVVQQARGYSGANPEYVSNTVAHLAQMGILEPRLNRVSALLAA